MKRLQEIDFIRGIAILIMTFANMAYLREASDISFFFRFVSSLAAPIFVTFSGLMIAYQLQSKDFSYLKGKLQKRGLQLFLGAIIVDLFASNVIPFISFDVLYIIGLSMFITPYLQRLKKGWQFALTLSPFIIAFFLQHFFTYNPLPYDIELNSIEFSSSSFLLVLRNFLFEGWFPFFPWIGLSFLGFMLLNFLKTIRTYPLFIVIAFCLSLLGIPYLGAAYVREGYVELFYPPTMIFMLMAILFILSLLSVIRFKKDYLLTRMVSLLGKNSLSCYLLHLLFIRYVLEEFFPASVNVKTFFLYYLFLLSFLYLQIFVRAFLKKKKGEWNLLLIKRVQTMKL